MINADEPSANGLAAHLSKIVADLQDENKRLTAALAQVTQDAARECGRLRETNIDLCAEIRVLLQQRDALLVAAKAWLAHDAMPWEIDIALRSAVAACEEVVK